MTRRRYRIVAARRLNDGTVALWRAWTVRQKATAVAGAAVLALKIAPQEPRIMPILTGAWAVAAWRASNPSRTSEGADDDSALTSDGSGQKGPTPGPGEGITIIQTTNGQATATPDPHQPNRTNITWETP